MRRWSSAERSCPRMRTRAVIILILVILALWVVWPDNPGIHIGSFDQTIGVVRGLDLQGGLCVLLEADVPAETDITTEQLQAARDIIENRVNALGVTEPVVQVAGARRILVELPGIEDTEQALASIRATALLEFVDFSLVTAIDAANMVKLTIETDYARSAETGPTPTPEAGAPTPTAPLPVFHTVLTGADLDSAAAAQGPFSGFVVDIQFSDSGTAAFATYTSQHVGDILAIVLDKQIISAPRISEPITEGRAQITGNFTLEEANRLAVQLRFGSLPIPLKILQSKAVGPTLRQDSLEKSMQAGIIGLALVIAFMVLYYRLPGVIASVALLIYAVLA